MLIINHTRGINLNELRHRSKYLKCPKYRDIFDLCITKGMSLDYSIYSRLHTTLPRYENH